MSSTKGSKKCNSCGKMASKPYTYTVVPSTGMYGKQKVYIKSEVKTKRVDLRGNEKVFVYYYCNSECYKNKQLQEIYKI